MCFRMGRLASILTVLAASAISSSTRADQPIFGEPQYWGFADDFGTIPGDFDNDGNIDIVAPSNGPVLLNKGDARHSFSFRMTTAEEAVGWPSAKACRCSSPHDRAVL